MIFNHYKLQDLVDNNKEELYKQYLKENYLDRSDCLDYLLNHPQCISYKYDGYYQGQCGWAFLLEDDIGILLVSDYFGSCSGCDAYEASTGFDDYFELTRTIIYNGHLCENVDDAIRYINEESEQNKFSSHEVFKLFLDDLEQYKNNI